MHFIIEPDQETECTFGEYWSHDGTVIINLALIDSPYELISTIIHEELHRCIEETGEVTKEKQDHFIMPRLFF
jgi:hypothetical protein